MKCGSARIRGPVEVEVEVGWDFVQLKWRVPLVVYAFVVIMSASGGYRHHFACHCHTNTNLP